MRSILIVIGTLLVLAAVAMPLVWSDEDREAWLEYGRVSTGVALLSSPVYKEECGSCHMAYPPGLLPTATWQKIMSGLENHFGDNAELDNETQTKITEFLVSNSANQSNYRRSRRFAAVDDKSEASMRISETPYFIHEHDEIPSRLVTGNREVTSFSNCNACHRKAEQASFRERDILIPGHGKWDD